nr:MAG TPA: hypothetical protein [Caudoviricetes sp.]
MNERIVSMRGLVAGWIWTPQHYHDGLAPNHPPGSKSNGRRPLDRALSQFFARAFQV